MAALPLESMGVPVIILKEGTSRSYGKEAVRSNIMAVRAIAEILKTTYGPKGMDKMLVDSLGDITITNDGATILDKLDLQHPAGKMLVQIAKGQDEEAGDGTKTSVIFAGELLKEGEKLLNNNIHPTIIVEGYKKALEKALEILYEIGKPIDINDHETLKKIALTSLNSKAVGEAADYFADIAVEAIKTIVEKRGDKYYVDLNNIQIIKKHGGSLRDTKLIKGIVIDKEVVHPDMPRRVENAKIAVLDTPLEIEKPEIDLEVSITSPDLVKRLLEKQEKILAEKVEKIVSVGANVVVTQKGIDEVAQHFLAKRGILAVRRVKRSDIEKIAKATGAKIITSLRDLKEDYLGYAELVEERKVGEDKMIFIEGAKNPKSVTILLRGANDMLLDEAERNVLDALHSLRNILREPKIVGGGGAVEIELAERLRDFARTVGGKEQMAIEAYAEALEVIPTVLAESAGMDALDTLLQLKAMHNQGHKFAGINVIEGKVEEDMTKINVYEPIIVKKQVIKSASEAAISLLKIDDVIAAAPPKKESKGKGEEEEEEGSGPGSFNFD